MAKRKSKKVLIKFSVIRLTIFLVLLAVIISGGLIFRAPIEKAFNGQTLSTTDAVIDYNGLVVHYIDVGQADCIAIEFPDGKKMLIDAAVNKEENINQMLTYLDANVFNEPDEKKVFDIVLLTHSDADHCGGMPNIFEEYEVKKVYRPQIYINKQDEDNDAYKGTKTQIKDTNIYTKTINAMYNEDGCEMVYTNLATVNSKDKILGGSGDDEYYFKFYTPISSYYTDVNDYSPIMSLHYRSKVLMFTGDAEKVNEGELIDSGKELPKVDVLKVGHHGSDTSSTQEFLNKILPKYAVIQVGEGNSYNHPTEGCLNRLALINATVFRTDINNNIICNVKTNNELLMCSDIKVVTFYFRVEYLMLFLAVVSFYICFMFGIKNTNSKKI